MIKNIEIQTRIEQEEEVLSRSLQTLANSQKSEHQKFIRFSKEARELTSEIVNSRRDVEKQMLANEESISHSLSERAKTESDGIEELLDSPYFARIVLEEHESSGTRIIEYKLGKHTNLDTNIIDWKNAPLARLFYEYEEGEDYLEDIRGRERVGIVKLRHKVKITNSELKELSCPLGTFKKSKDSIWEQKVGGKAASGGKFELPSILSLITADQFRLITEESSEPVILHGVAGSGKTSVALHRLSWQLAKSPDSNPLILTPTEILARYVQNSLESLEVSKVKIATISDWLHKLEKESGIFLNFNKDRVHPRPHIARIKNSLAIVKTVSRILNEEREYACPSEILLHALSSPNIILEEDTSGLIKIEHIHEARSESKKRYEQQTLDWSDAPLFLFIESIKNKKNRIPRFSHLFLDEFQDVTPVELALIGSCVKKKENITITGDTEQHTKDSHLYKASLDALFLAGKSERNNANPAHSLSISHRSSLPIMKYADHFLGTQRTTEGREGKPPLLILCNNRDHGISEMRLWIERVYKSFSGDTILILTLNEELAKEVYSLLRPELNDGVSLLRDAPRSTDGMVLIASIHQCKGLEFPHVAIWDVSRENFPGDGVSRKRLYLAATRAEEHLALFAWGDRSPLLPNLSSKIQRVYDVRREGPEESEPQELFS